jgi:hypothetical protein
VIDLLSFGHAHRWTVKSAFLSVIFPAVPINWSVLHYSYVPNFCTNPRIKSSLSVYINKRKRGSFTVWRVQGKL